MQESISNIKKTAPDYAKKLQISIVMNPENDFDCINEIYIDGSELSRLAIQPSIIERDHRSEITAPSEQYVWKIEYQNFLSLLSYYRRYPEENVSPIADKWLTNILYDHTKICTRAVLRTTDAPSGPCIPGKLRLFTNADGFFFPCESQRNIAGYVHRLIDRGFQY